MAININIKNLPPYAKVIISVLPSLILSIAIVMLVIMPKQKKIKELDANIDKQNNEIAASQAKSAKLDILKQENERLLKRINELQVQLPEEKEISSLLKQVSDMGTAAGLEIKSWKPGQKTTHGSGIVYEIPVSVDVIGTYHNLGYFLGSLTKLNRIINISDMKLTNIKTGKDAGKGESLLSVSFKASTFSAIPESELADATKGAKKGGAKPGAKPVIPPVKK
jgi:type IV pilus assembly protein PilO